MFANIPNKYVERDSAEMALKLDLNSGAHTLFTYVETTNVLGLVCPLRYIVA